MLKIKELKIAKPKQKPYVYIEVTPGWKIPVPVPDWTYWIAMNPNGEVRFQYHPTNNY